MQSQGDGPGIAQEKRVTALHRRIDEVMGIV
jgi:hypothetical protein